MNSISGGAPMWSTTVQKNTTSPSPCDKADPPIPFINFGSTPRPSTRCPAGSKPFSIRLPTTGSTTGPIPNTSTRTMQASSSSGTASLALSNPKRKRWFMASQAL
ncbi:UNVERIFIED_CONTAM: hypothetical protein GTU68_061068 [Idotea baltica]|nr:hypothetical protein [Idotea baltica]